jgi:hypothetical protein
MCELARRLRHGLDGFLLQVGRQQVVIPGRCDVGGQEELGAVVGAPIGESHRRDQHNAVQVDLVALLQNGRQLG